MFPVMSTLSRRLKYVGTKMLLDSNDNRLMQAYGNKHVLLLRNVKETGNFD